MWHKKLLDLAYKEMLPLAKPPEQESEMQRLLHEEMLKLIPEDRWEYGHHLGAVTNYWQRSNGITYITRLIGRHHQDMLIDGITQRINSFSKEQIARIHEALRDEPVYNSHIWRLSDKVKYSKDEAAAQYTQCCYHLSTIAKIPELLEIATRSEVIAIVHRHLGCMPVIYQMNLMWTWPNKGEPLQTQSWHRDYDGFRFVTMLVYLTDVTDKSGPHCYKMGSHIAADGTETAITGNAGHMILEDGYGLHKGLPVEEGARLVFWVRYGVYDNGFSKDCGAPVVSANIANRYALEPLFIPLE